MATSLVSVNKECTYNPAWETMAKDAFIQCPATFDGILCWPPTPGRRFAELPCPPVKGMDPRETLLKLCLENGEWSLEAVDYQDCFTLEARRSIRSYADVLKILKYALSGLSVTSLALAMVIWAIVWYIRPKLKSDFAPLGGQQHHRAYRHMLLFSAAAAEILFHATSLMLVSRWAYEDFYICSFITGTHACTCMIVYATTLVYVVAMLLTDVHDTIVTRKQLFVVFFLVSIVIPISLILCRAAFERRSRKPILCAFSDPVSPIACVTMLLQFVTLVVALCLNNKILYRCGIKGGVPSLNPSSESQPGSVVAASLRIDPGIQHPDEGERSKGSPGEPSSSQPGEGGATNTERSQVCISESAAESPGEESRNVDVINTVLDPGSEHNPRLTKLRACLIRHRSICCFIVIVYFLLCELFSTMEKVQLNDPKRFWPMFARFLDGANVSLNSLKGTMLAGFLCFVDWEVLAQVPLLQRYLTSRYSSA